MTIEEAKQAFKEQIPVVYNCASTGTLILYHRIRGYLHEIRADGKLYVSLGLTDKKEHCLVWVEPRDIAAYDENTPLTAENYFKNSRQP